MAKRKGQAGAAASCGRRALAQSTQPREPSFRACTGTSLARFRGRSPPGQRPPLSVAFPPLLSALSLHARVCSTDTCPRCQGSAGQGHVCCASARVPATECGACQQQGRVPRSRTSFAEARSTGRAGRDTAAAHATHAQLLSLAAGFPANPGAGLHAPDLALVSTFTRRFPNLAAQPPVSSNSRWLC